MVKGVLREIENERLGLEVTPDDRAYYVKYLDKFYKIYIYIDLGETLYL